MILEYAAAGGAILLAAGIVALVAVLLAGARPNDEGVFDAAELAAASLVATRAGDPPWSGSHPARTPGPCPNLDCGGRHCSTWRRHGVPCGERSPGDGLPAYAVGLPLPRDGRHAVSTVLVRWLAGDWWETPMPVRLRRQLGRMAGAARVPVQLGFPVGRLP